MVCKALGLMEMGPREATQGELQGYNNTTTTTTTSRQQPQRRQTTTTPTLTTTPLSITAVCDLLDLLRSE